MLGLELNLRIGNFLSTFVRHPRRLESVGGHLDFHPTFIRSRNKVSISQQPMSEKAPWLQSAPETETQRLTRVNNSGTRLKLFSDAIKAWL